MGNALYGLQRMRSGKEICSLLSILATKIQSSDRAIDGRHIGNALYGLQGISSDRFEVLQMVSSLTPKIVNCNDTMNPQEIGNALYGLQRLSSSSPEVLLLLAALTPKIVTMKGNLTDQNVGNALYGLRGMSSDSVEVRRLVSALATKIHLSNMKFHAQALGNALYGLQGMRCDNKEVKQLVRALTIKVRHSDAMLSSIEVGTALYGLQSMTNDSHEVSLLLSAVTEKVLCCDDSLPHQLLGNAIYGIMGCLGSHTNGRNEEAYNDLENVKIHQTLGKDEEFDKHDTDENLFKVQAQGSRKESDVQLLLDYLYAQTERLVGFRSEEKDLIALCQSITLSLWAIQLYSDEEYGRWSAINDKLLSQLSTRCVTFDSSDSTSSIPSSSPSSMSSSLSPSLPFSSPPSTSSSSTSSPSSSSLPSSSSSSFLGMTYRSNAERTVSSAIRNVLQNSQVKISTNELLFNLFESDIVLRFPLSRKVNNKDFVQVVEGVERVERKREINVRENTVDDIETEIRNVRKSSGDELELIINIEVDGVHHQLPKTARYCTLRDQYLKSRGVSVVRLTVAEITDLRADELENWVLDTISEEMLEAM